MRTNDLEVFAIKTLGLEPRRDLYHRPVGLREQMRRLDGVRTWHRLEFRDAATRRP